METRGWRDKEVTMSTKAVVLSVGLLLASSCTGEQGWTNRTADLRIHNRAKVSVGEGIWGTLVKTEGNCMPVVDRTKCREYPVQREIVVHEYTKRDDTLHESLPFFDEVYTALVATVTSDEEGFFEYELEPGKYSVLVRESDHLYANGFDGQGGIAPVTVEPSKVSEVFLNLDYASY